MWTLLFHMHLSSHPSPDLSFYVLKQKEKEDGLVCCHHFIWRTEGPLFTFFPFYFHEQVCTCNTTCCWLFGTRISMNQNPSSNWAFWLKLFSSITKGLKREIKINLILFINLSPRLSQAVLAQKGDCAWEKNQLLTKENNSWFTLGKKKSYWSLLDQEFNMIYWPISKEYLNLKEIKIMAANVYLGILGTR